MLDLQSVLEVATQNAASDIHLKVGLPPLFRVDGNLVPARSAPRIAGTDLAQILDQLTTEAQRERFNETRELDFGYSAPGLGRFRVNVFFQRGNLGMVLRLIPAEARSIQQLFLPPVLSQLCMASRGLVLVTGATGSGKTTTLAAMIQHINSNKSCHIITIEDPIEYLHRHKKSLVSQREVPNDAATFSRALRAALRQAPDVVMLGEMRDLDTIRTAITAAETGHLLLSSLHTIGAAKTVDRIIDTFPAEQQSQIRVQLSMVLKAVVSQRLVPTVDGGRVPVFEVMTVNAAIQNMIRDGRTHQIDNVIYGGSDQSMMSMDAELQRLVRTGRITRDIALIHAANPETLAKRI